MEAKVEMKDAVKVPEAVLSARQFYREHISGKKHVSLSTELEKEWIKHELSLHRHGFTVDDALQLHLVDAVVKPAPKVKETMFSRLKKLRKHKKKKS